MPLSQIPLRSRAVAITGANRGIGLATARELLRRGARVVAGVRRPEAMPSLDGGEMLVLPLSLDDGDSCRDFIEEACRRCGRLDGLVNNAGVYLDEGMSPFELEEAMLRDTLDVNVLGPWRLCRLVLPRMIENGFGRVVNLSSGYGALDAMAAQTPPAYGLSKLALNALTRQFAGAVQGDIKVNALDPGWVRTDMGGSDAPRAVEEPAREIADLVALGSDGPNGVWMRRGDIVPW